MKAGTRKAALLAALLASAAATAQDPESRFLVSVSALRDEAGSEAYDMATAIAPHPNWSLWAGVGTVRASEGTASPHGDTLDFGLELQGRHLGIQPAWRRWRDAGGFESTTAALSFSWRQAGWQVELLAEWPSFDVDYELLAQGQSVRRSFSFGGTAVGGGISYYGRRWGGYLRSLDYRYGSDVARLKALAQSPDLLRFPRLAAAVSSIATASRGALERQRTAGVEYVMTRVTWHADLADVRDAVTAADARSRSLGARVALSQRFDLDLVGGTSRADGFGSSGFGSATLTARW